MNQILRPELIFELGKLQVFHYVTLEDYGKNTTPKEIYWQDIIVRKSYGPFKSLNEAINHYTWTISQERSPKNPDAKVIHVDFITKKRVRFEEPQ